MSSAKKRLDQVSDHLNEGSAQRANEPPGVLCEVKEHEPGHNVATLILGDPNKLNLMSSRLFHELTQHCRTLSKDEKLRAVILTGNPGSKKPAFVGGAELSEVSSLSTAEEAGAYVTRTMDACAAVSALPVPVIARVHGLAIGAGVQLMASCDLRVASKTSRFAMPEAKVGLPSAIQTALLPGLIGWGNTRRLLYLAEVLSAEKAREWGLVEEVVQDEAELDSVVDEWVKKIIDMPPDNMRRQKKLVTLWQQSTVQEGILAGVDAMRETFVDGGKETQAHMRKFLHKSEK
ncbi:hypothetical protein CKM354_001096800 [Cercospora kikuchii]|uniref:Enoyl-CoA hydratase n=1 Tax=Cercospora kikuchii TaxID=84275 RepID=A0A9P3CNN7_9PEZI|nr:uncharacterized protein CKM354_001096800 [Cercospora kikuchii]GIZ47889.1 hypothetical protein CKM354_001096800 [Cercospora kikuchii]